MIDTATATRDEAIAIPSAWDLDWESIGTSDGNVPGPTLKFLRTDPETGAITYLCHLPPNWNDKELDVHPTVEEGFIMAGIVKLADRVLGAGDYLYRPAGILHGPVSCPHDLGCTIFNRMDGPMKIMHYSEGEFPAVDSQPITDHYLHTDVEWSEKTVTDDLPWETISEGGWAGTRLRWIHRNKRTGGGFVMIDIPAGWAGTGSAARGAVEEFIFKGDLTAGGVAFGKWGYAYRPAGEPAGQYASQDGATLLTYWNGANEL